MRLHRDVDDQLYTRTLNVHFYGKPRTAEEILDVVIDNFDLDQFIELRLWIDEKAVSVDHTFTFAELSSLGSLSIDYRIEDNTPDSIKNRRITWLVGQLAGNCEKTSESWMKIRMISAFVEKNYLDGKGSPRSFRQLHELVNNQ